MRRDTSVASGGPQREQRPARRFGASCAVRVALPLSLCLTLHLCQQLGSPTVLAAAAARTQGTTHRAAARATTAALEQNAPSADGSCTYPGKTYRGRPWALQRVLLDDLWKESTGKGVRVAVVDTGVDARHPQLAANVDSGGGNFLPAKDSRGRPLERGAANGTSDSAGHGTRVAGIIAARPTPGTGFAGLAPDATILPVRHNDAAGNGSAGTLAQAIRYAVAADADVINISQDTAGAVRPSAALEEAVAAALRSDVVLVAAAGNRGTGGRSRPTYPASYPGVLAVAASDRSNERAPFSQAGDFVGVAAPGVDIVSTVPGGGHCADHGTSFAAPYAAGVAALLRAKHGDWTRQQIVARIQQTAERSAPGADRLLGWGVVDPVRALDTDGVAEPPVRPVAEAAGHASAREAPVPGGLRVTETADERDGRLAAYAVLAGAALAASVAGAAVAGRRARRVRRVRREGADLAAR
ncbi:Subtilisin E precursor [Streptomyces sp. YIM 130001]|uniref:type VII secretion-associated serine protease mycosin n=1 Tax=Streptomyces sp. YIM 130001 TaxID=2259644 RepID=UPI000E657FBB|nr:type VII secretion-associated serine protease mycosin [Streptomyces sp. YIM 130001]RII08014.1 Subtilisin E precursor [Streptomyces sp. YIM 130001]